MNTKISPTGPLSSHCDHREGARGQNEQAHAWLMWRLKGFTGADAVTAAAGKQQ